MPIISIVSRGLMTGLLLSSALLTGCATPKPVLTQFDLGPLPAQASTAAPDAAPDAALTTSQALPLSLAEPRAPTWLDNQRIYYRLDYDNPQQPRSYAQSRWSMSPANLFGQRLQARFAQAGIPVLPASAGAAQVPVLRIELHDFSQNFAAPGNSSGRVMLHAVVLQGRTLLAQKTIVHTAPAPSANALGGVAALTQASDAAIAEMLNWVKTLPRRQP